MRREKSALSARYEIEASNNRENRLSRKERGEILSEKKDEKGIHIHTTLLEIQFVLVLKTLMLIRRRFSFGPLSLSLLLFSFEQARAFSLPRLP